METIDQELTHESFRRKRSEVGSERLDNDFVSTVTAEKLDATLNGRKAWRRRSAKDFVRMRVEGQNEDAKCARDVETGGILGTTLGNFACLLEHRLMSAMDAIEIPDDDYVFLGTNHAGFVTGENAEVGGYYRRSHAAIRIQRRVVE
jgi:hypothetical protein